MGDHKEVGGETLINVACCCGQQALLSRGELLLILLPAQWLLLTRLQAA